MSLQASSEDRIYLTSRWRISRRRFVVLLALCLLLHALIVALFVREYQPLPVEPEVIPVELVPEPEAEPEPEKQDEQKPEEKPPEPPPPQQQERSEIATDAPKLQERESPAQQDKEATRVPEEAPQEAQPPPPDAVEEVEPEPAPEALQPAKKEPPPPKPEKTPAERFGTFTPLPDMEFERGGAKTLMNGNARATYESILFGLIVPRIQLPPTQGPLKGQTQVNFTVDSFGRIVFASVTRTSGDPKIDAAVVAGLRKAAPFPPPPGGLPVTLFLTYGRK